jgi:peptidoglycan/LPS O-acetylase OafA/YrhL
MVLADGISESRISSPGGPKGATVVRPPRRDTSLVLCVACGLIVNSHLEAFWPQSFLAVDGLLGNSIFYLLSGFGIGSSLWARPQRFGPFLARRLVRIYPAVIVTVLLFVGIIGGHAYRTVNGMPPWSLGDAFHSLIWPTPFTYVRNIIAIYVIGYVVALPRSTTVISAALVAMIGFFLAACASHAPGLAAGAKLALGSLPVGIYDAFDTALFLGGMSSASARRFTVRGGGVNATLAALLCIAYFALKYVMVVTGVGASLYPLLFVLVAAVSYLALGVLSDPLVIEPLKRIPLLGSSIDLVASHTLEIYVIHEVLVGTFGGLAGIPFPINIALLVLITIAGAALLQRLTSPLRRWVDAITGPAATGA